MPTPDLQNIAELLYGAGQPAGDAAPDDVSGVGAPVQQGIVDPWAQDAATALAPPSPAPPTAADPFASFPVGKQKAKIASGESGYSADKMNQIEAGPMGTAKMEQKRKGIEGQIADRWSGVKQSQAEANKFQLETEQRLGQAEADSIAAKGVASNKIAGMITQHAQDTEKLAHDAMLAKQNAAADYRQKLLEIGEVNPNALWDDAGTSGQIGIAAAAVLHEMLNVKGIKTSAMDTINNAIRNKIDAQIANINKQKAVAAGFKDLYDMTVAESASQMEVKAKLQGYYLKAMENQIAATLAPYDSNVARLKQQQAMGIIRQAQIKNMAEVEQHIGREIDQAYSRQITMRGQNLQAATAKANREAELEVARIRASAEKQKAAEPPIYLFDRNGKGRFKLKAGIETKTAMSKLEAGGKFLAAMDTMDKIREMERKLKPGIDGITGTRFAPEDQRRYTALVTTLAHELVAARGERPTDKDVEQQLKALPTDTKLMNGGVARVLADTQQSLGSSFNNQVRQFFDDVPEELQPQGAKERLAEGSLLDAELTANGAEDIQPAKWDSIIKQARQPDALEVKLPTENKREFKEYTMPLWQAYRKENPDGKVVVSGAATVSPEFKKYPTKGFDAVREIASHALSDQEAMQQLRVLASEEPIASSSDEDFTINANTRSYARWFLNKISQQGVDNPNAPAGSQYVPNREALGD